jgi:hypothetical protein
VANVTKAFTLKAIQTIHLSTGRTTDVPPVTLRSASPINLSTDCSVVYYTLVKGTGSMMRSQDILQDLQVTMTMERIKSGYGLLVRWVPSEANLAEPFSRGVNAL